MKDNSLLYSETNSFTNLILDFLDKKKELNPFVNRWFNENDIVKQTTKFEF